MHRVALGVDYSCSRETVQQMVVSEKVALAEFEVVLPLLEQFFAEEGFYTPQAKIGAELVELIGAQNRLTVGRVVK